MLVQSNLSLSTIEYLSKGLRERERWQHQQQLINYKGTMSEGGMQVKESDCSESSKGSTKRKKERKELMVTLNDTEIKELYLKVIFCQNLEFPADHKLRVKFLFPLSEVFASQP